MVPRSQIRLFYALDLFFTGKKLWPSQNAGIQIAEPAPEEHMIFSRLGN
jgi:hypothetical protein